MLLFKWIGGIVPAQTMREGDRECRRVAMAWATSKLAVMA